MHVNDLIFLLALINKESNISSYSENNKKPNSPETLLFAMQRGFQLRTELVYLFHLHEEYHGTAQRFLFKCKKMY